MIDNTPNTLGHDLARNNPKNKLAKSAKSTDSTESARPTISPPISTPLPLQIDILITNNLKNTHHCNSSDIWEMPNYNDPPLLRHNDPSHSSRSTRAQRKSLESLPDQNRSNPQNSQNSQNIPKQQKISPDFKKRVHTSYSNFYNFSKKNFFIQTLIFIIIISFLSPITYAAMLDRFDSTFFINEDHPGEGLYDLALQFSHNPNRESTPQFIVFHITPPYGAITKNVFIKTPTDIRPTLAQPLPGSTQDEYKADMTLKSTWYTSPMYIRVDFIKISLPPNLTPDIALAPWKFVALLCSDRVTCYPDVIDKTVFTYTEIVQFPKYYSSSTQYLTRWDLPKKNEKIINSINYHPNSIFEIVLTEAFTGIDPKNLNIFTTNPESSDSEEKIDFFDLKFVGYFSFESTLTSRPIENVCFLNSIPVDVKPMGGAGRGLRVYLSTTLSKSTTAQKKIIKPIEINKKKRLLFSCNQQLFIKTDWQSGPYAYSVIKLGHRRETTSQSYEDLVYPHLFYRELSPLYSGVAPMPPPEIREIRTELNTGLGLIIQSFILNFRQKSSHVLLSPFSSTDSLLVPTLSSLNESLPVLSSSPSSSIRDGNLYNTDNNNNNNLSDNNNLNDNLLTWDTRQYILPNTNFTLRTVFDDVLFDTQLEYSVNEKRSKSSKNGFSAIFIAPVGAPPSFSSKKSNDNDSDQDNGQNNGQNENYQKKNFEKHETLSNNGYSIGNDRYNEDLDYFRNADGKSSFLSGDQNPGQTSSSPYHSTSSALESSSESDCDNALFAPWIDKKTKKEPFDYGASYTVSQLSYEIPTGAPLLSFEYIANETGAPNPESPSRTGQWEPNGADDTPFYRSSPISPYRNYQNCSRDELLEDYPVQVYQMVYLPNITLCSPYPVWFTRIQLESRQTEMILDEQFRPKSSWFTQFHIASYFNVSGLPGLPINNLACGDITPVTTSDMLDDDMDLLYEIAAKEAKEWLKKYENFETNEKNNDEKNKNFEILQNENGVQNNESNYSFLSSWSQTFVDLIDELITNMSAPQWWEQLKDELYGLFGIENTSENNEINQNNFQKGDKNFEKDENDNQSDEANPIDKFLSQDIDPKIFPLFAEWQQYQRRLKQGSSSTEGAVDDKQQNNLQNDDKNNHPANSNRDHHQSNIVSSFSSILSSFNSFYPLINQFSLFFENLSDDLSNLYLLITHGSTPQDSIAFIDDISPYLPISIQSLFGIDTGPTNIGIDRNDKKIENWQNLVVQSNQDFKHDAQIYKNNIENNQKNSIGVFSKTPKVKSRKIPLTLPKTNHINPYASFYDGQNNHHTGTNNKNNTYSNLNQSLQQTSQIINPNSSKDRFELEPLSSKISSNKPMLGAISEHCQEPLHEKVDGNLIVYAENVAGKGISIELVSNSFCSLSKQQTGSGAKFELLFDQIHVSFPFGRAEWAVVIDDQVKGSGDDEFLDITDPLRPRTPVLCSYELDQGNGYRTHPQSPVVGYIYHQENVIKINQLPDLAPDQTTNHFEVKNVQKNNSQNQDDSNSHSIPDLMSMGLGAGNNVQKLRLLCPSVTWQERPLFKQTKKSDQNLPCFHFDPPVGYSDADSTYSNPDDDDADGDGGGDDSQDNHDKFQGNDKKNENSKLLSSTSVPPPSTATTAYPFLHTQCPLIFDLLRQQRTKFRLDLRQSDDQSLLSPSSLSSLIQSQSTPLSFQSQSESSLLSPLSSSSSSSSSSLSSSFLSTLQSSSRLSQQGDHQFSQIQESRQYDGRIVGSWQNINPTRGIRYFSLIFSLLVGLIIFATALCFIARRYDDYRRTRRIESLRVITEDMDDDYFSSSDDEDDLDTAAGNDDDDAISGSGGKKKRGKKKKNTSTDDDRTNAGDDRNDIDGIDTGKNTPPGRKKRRKKHTTRVRALLAELHAAEGVNYYDSDDSDDYNSTNSNSNNSKHTAAESDDDDYLAYQQQQQQQQRSQYQYTTQSSSPNQPNQQQSSSYQNSKYSINKPTSTTTTTTTKNISSIQNQSKTNLIASDYENDDTTASNVHQSAAPPPPTARAGNQARWAAIEAAKAEHAKRKKEQQE